MTLLFHPATLQLLRLQHRGRRRRMLLRFCQPRRLILSAIATVLAVVWLGNAVMTVWLRETASAETLRALLSLGLVFYAGWHITKAAFFRPEWPFDWTSAEREVLSAMPLRPRDLVAYQLTSVTVTTTLKAGLFTLLLWPDLRCLWLGFLGVFLAMMTLELLRMAIEIVAWGMSRSAFLIYRAVIVSGLVAAGLAVGAVIAGSDSLAAHLNTRQNFFQPLLDILLQLNASEFGYTALPFQPFIDLILAESVTATNIAFLAAVCSITTLLAAGVIALYTTTAGHVAIREKRNYHPDARRQIQSPSTAISLRLWRIPRWGGVGALACRQLLGARHHWGSLLTAMIAPAVLASAPCFVIVDPNLSFLATTGTLAFYTFLLLPTALRFDFRRDLDRLATLKGLPITPAAVVIGQTLAPVLIATLFQSIVLMFAAVARSLPPHSVFTAILVMIPLNVLVFSLDNLIYLLYPYRMQQEGLEVFLRTMLTFTGKGLLFTLGLVVLSAWGFAAVFLTRGISDWTGVILDASAVFAIGVIVGPSLLAALVLYSLCRTYRRMDPIEDLPR